MILQTALRFHKEGGENSRSESTEAVTSTALRFHKEGGENSSSDVKSEQLSSESTEAVTSTGRTSTCAFTLNPSDFTLVFEFNKIRNFFSAAYKLTITRTRKEKIPMQKRHFEIQFSDKMSQKSWPISPLKRLI